MEQKEDLQLNRPAKDYLKRKLKCIFSRVGFTFSAGELDVLAYNSNNKCFHVCEGKRSSNVASVGHAIGQLIAYISMIQEGGYDFLDRISEQERLSLSDFSTFLENRAISACFYVVLPEARREKLLNPARLMLSNMGEFGASIGIFFASRNKCELVVPAKPISIKIRRVWDKKDFLAEVSRKFFASTESKGLVENPPYYPNCLQIKEDKGNPFLHYEVWTRTAKKIDKSRVVEVAFHLEFAKAHLQNETTEKRKLRLKRILSAASKQLQKKGLDFKYQSHWGKRWSRLYFLYNTKQVEYDDKILEDVVALLKQLVGISKPLFDRINWGRKKDRPNEEA